MLSKNKRGIKQSIRKKVFENYPNCVYCGAKSENIDHVIPRSEGGTNALSNLVGSCVACNQRKRNWYLG